MTSESSFSKVSLHPPIVGSLFLKIHVFLDVQMLQHIIIMIFIAKCNLKPAMKVLAPGAKPTEKAAWVGFIALSGSASL
jgi:hypothetical protein